MSGHEAGEVRQYLIKLNPPWEETQVTLLEKLKTKHDKLLLKYLQFSDRQVQASKAGSRSCRGAGSANSRAKPGGASVKFTSGSALYWILGGFCQDINI